MAHNDPRLSSSPRRLESHLIAVNGVERARDSPEVNLVICTVRTALVKTSALAMIKGYAAVNGAVGNGDDPPTEYVVAI
jgi:hypothetical protein